MNDTAVDIAWGQLAGFLLVLAIPVLINWRWRLGLASTLGLSTLRMVLQLGLVGLYLEFLFELNHPGLNLGWVLLMLVVGSSAILGGAGLPRRCLLGPVALGMALGLLPLLAIMLGLLQPQPWYSAQYLVPLAGMLLGNSMNGNVVALRGFYRALEERQLEYQGRLALGARPRDAAFPFLQESLRNAVNPLLASMATTGLVTLPGMMTGQILGGSDPMVAIKYQLVILVAILVMLFVSVVTALSLAVRFGISPTGRLKVSPLGP